MRFVGCEVVNCVHTCAYWLSMWEEPTQELRRLDKLLFGRTLESVVLGCLSLHICCATRGCQLIVCRTVVVIVQPVIEILLILNQFAEWLGWWWATTCASETFWWRCCRYDVLILSRPPRQARPGHFVVPAGTGVPQVLCCAVLCFNPQPCIQSKFSGLFLSPSPPTKQKKETTKRQPLFSPCGHCQRSNLASFVSRQRIIAFLSSETSRQKKKKKNEQQQTCLTLATTTTLGRK